MSPPPTIDIKEFLFVLSEIFFAKEIVPFEKFLFSKYPAGPFQRTVLEISIILLIFLIVFGPISRIISFSLTHSKSLKFASPSAEPETAKSKVL